MEEDGLPKRVAIITDSAACVPRELAEKYGIRVVPINVIFEGKVYRDGVDITPEEVYSLLKGAKRLPTTASPPPGVYLETYREASKESDSILCISLSSGLSSVFESAWQAKEMAKEELPGVAIEAIDCRTAAGGQAFVVTEAARAAASGHSLSEVIEVAKSVMAKVNVIVILDTLYYLAKGGRIPKAAAWAGSFFDIKPIIEVAKGEATLLARARTKPRGVEHLMRIMRERVGLEKPLHVIVMHANAWHEAEKLKDRVVSEFDCSELYTAEFTPVMGVHAGPGLLGLAFYA
jgi:DegV family protein with EDD domain